MDWTIERVKEELPDIDIDLNGKIEKARISGRKEKFATVTTGDHSFQYAWSTITNVLNEKRPLRI